MKTTSLLALFLTFAVAGPALAQQERRFGWTPGNNELVRLDPANYHGGNTFHPGPNGGNIQVDIKSQQPVTVFLTPEGAWNDALQHPDEIAGLQQVCPHEHVAETRYVCFLPPEPMTIIIRDERYSPDHAVFAGLGAVLNPANAVLNPDNKAQRVVGLGLAAVLNSQPSTPHHFVSPNDVQIQYFRWICVENCIQPEFEWIRQIKEKYNLTSFLKIYGGYTPQSDGEQVSVRIKSPVPMVVAVLPSSIAAQLPANPQMLEAALQKASCQQRGVQALQFQCTFNAADGPQSLVVGPESTSRVPHKKAEVEWLADKCVENCAPPPPSQ
jgi:hypothetical protein